jgi:hypothetical protein
MMSIVRMDSILWNYAKYYRKLWLADNPEHADASVGFTTMCVLRALEMEGHAEKHIDPNGDVTFRATDKFMDGKKSPRGPLISFGPTLQ